MRMRTNKNSSSLLVSLQAMKEWAPILLFWSIIAILSIGLFFLCRKNSVNQRLPPGPPGWPLVGNMFDLGTMPHRTLAGFRGKYGDVVWLNLGAIKTMSILSAKAAADFFKNHDLSFAERTVRELMRVHDYNKGSVALAPYGPYWRVMRRLCTVDMIANKRISETSSVRRKCVDNMLAWIEEEAASKGTRGIHVAKFVFLMSFNMLGNLMVSRDLFDPQSATGSEFFNAMNLLMQWTGHANIGDFFPWLQRFDLQGLRKKMERDLGKALEIASRFVKERVEEQPVGAAKREKEDFLDVLLAYEGNGKDEPAKIPDHDLNIFILEIFMAGSETTSSTTEWAMTELLLNPEKMTKLKTELTIVLGNRKLEERDIENLPYLQAVMKETLRLHPPIPLLVPRRAIHDTTFMGYNIPENTQVLVNAWAIGRDPDCWEDPNSFKPERFVASNVDYRGQHYEFIPFGAGRRMCAGIPLAHRVLHLVLGSLIHQFDWEYDGDVEKMDMGETLGVTMRKVDPLRAIPTKCRE